MAHGGIYKGVLADTSNVRHSWNNTPDTFPDSFKDSLPGITFKYSSYLN